MRNNAKITCLVPSASIPGLPRVCAVSYLNTIPLVWGMLHETRGGRSIRPSFALPSECADQLASGEADIGIVPVIEMARQNSIISRDGIACRGPVRSICWYPRFLRRDQDPRNGLRFSNFSGARASDPRRKLGVEPRTCSRHAELAPMLGEADAALLIGDAALRVDPATLPFETLDLGEAWTRTTGLPMVFAVWAGAKALVTGENHQRYSDAFSASCRYGLARMEEIVGRESAVRRSRGTWRANI